MNFFDRTKKILLDEIERKIQKIEFLIGMI